MKSKIITITILLLTSLSILAIRSYLDVDADSLRVAHEKITRYEIEKRTDQKRRDSYKLLLHAASGNKYYIIDPEKGRVERWANQFGFWAVGSRNQLHSRGESKISFRKDPIGNRIYGITMGNDVIISLEEIMEEVAIKRKLMLAAALAIGAIALWPLVSLLNTPNTAKQE